MFSQGLNIFGEQIKDDQCFLFSDVFRVVNEAVWSDF